MPKIMIIPSSKCSKCYAPQVKFEVAGKKLKGVCTSCKATYIHEVKYKDVPETGLISEKKKLIKPNPDEVFDGWTKKKAKFELGYGMGERSFEKRLGLRTPKTPSVNKRKMRYDIEK